MSTASRGGEGRPPPSIDEILAESSRGADLSPGVREKASKGLRRHVATLGEKVGLMVVLGSFMANAGASLSHYHDRQEMRYAVANAEDHLVRQDGGVRIYCEELARAVDELKDQSPTFREWWQEIVQSGFPLHVGTPETMANPQLGGESIGQARFTAKRISIPLPIPSSRGFDEAGKAGLWVAPERIDSNIRRALSTKWPLRPNGTTSDSLADASDAPVRTTTIELGDEREFSIKLPTDEMMRDPSESEVRDLVWQQVKVTLAHEVAHVLDVVTRDGSMEGICEDPAPDDPFARACVMERENRVRKEIGALTHVGYNIDAYELELYHLRARSLENAYVKDRRAPSSLEKAGRVEGSVERGPKPQ